MSSWRWLVAQPSWWVGNVVTILNGIVAMGVIHSDHTTQVINGIAVILNQLVNQAAHFASPPRIPWTNEQRIAKGLPPVNNGGAK